MQIALLVELLTLAALGPQATVDSHAARRQASEPIATRQTLFSIPFSIEQPQRAGQEPREVQLFVSPDRGVTWQLYSRVEPARGRFMFRAGVDGEYWFQVRTLDRSGRVHPQPPGSPALHVVVDTAPPKLQLTARQGDAGEIVAAWEIDEPHPKPETLTVQYRAARDSQWQAVALDRDSRRVGETTYQGEVTWWPPGGSDEVQIRAEVADAADNSAVSHAQVKLERIAGPGRSGGVEADPFAVAKQTIDPWRPGVEASPVPWPADGGNFPPTQVVPSGPIRAVTGSVHPPIRNQYVEPQRPTADSSVAGLPPGERPRWVSSRLFELEYDLEAIDPSAVTRVELWGTRDGGQSWRSFATDDDNRSPLLVSVDEEAIYGFRVDVTTATGPAGQPPRPGSLPEIFVGVDLTKPVARITRAEEGNGAESGRLIIHWTAEDRMLTARPVSLAFSHRPDGPWSTVASGLENTGRYAWPVDHRVPERVYLRLEVRDEAGNVATHQTTEPVSLDRSRPSVRIRDVRPVTRTGQTPPNRYDPVR